MNKQQRNKLASSKQVLDSKIEELRDAEPGKHGAVLDAINAVKDDVEEIRDEEQEKFDNLPESLQNSERGETLQAGIESLERAMSELDSAIDSLGEHADTEARLQAYSLEHAEEITFEGCCYRIVSPETCDDVAATLKAQDIELDRLRAALAQAEAEAAECPRCRWLTALRAAKEPK